MKYYIVEPEVAGGFGERTLIDHSSGRMKVIRLHYQIEGWLGDELLESTPCFIMSRRLAEKVMRQRCTGAEFSNVEITISENFKQINGRREVPEFLWLQVDGIPGRDDFGMTADLNLVVSEVALRTMQENGVLRAACLNLFNEI